MAKRNNDFFNEKKDWSKVKDELLGCYLKPYIQKVILTHKKILYVDCFAGKGIFDDGSPGSPIIALDIIRECLEHSSLMNPVINSAFIDLNHSEDLRKNLKKYKNTTIISGKFEDEILKMLRSKSNDNIFLYIDPYGIKSLDYNIFQQLSNNYSFNSIELLINLNSFGFIREGCRVLGTKFEDVEILEDLVEYDSTKLDTSDESKVYLDEIAGGDYWRNIITQMKKKEIDAYTAEALFTEEYCKRLRKDFKYVLNMPLRIKKGHTPKYRMIHATNHTAGCLLMVNNICGRWQAMRDVQNDGQLSFFTENIENENFDLVEIEEKLICHLNSYSNLTRLNDINADFFMKYGAVCKTSDLSGIYKNLENNNKIIVKRTPDTTKTGQKSKFFSDDKKKKTEIRWKL